ncbi:MAG: heat-inducible transcription repressor HrcA [Microthrixaceae bacterium]|nr:heat-inducible transcription repressor HrcA [Microthrixaceae bacterium]
MAGDRRRRTIEEAMGLGDAEAGDTGLDARKSAILRAVVQQYIETAQPVGSNAIAKREDVTVSSATVRNEMHDLEDEGYLVQPHTSAGRVPTEKGYRFFVDGMGVDAMDADGSLNPGAVAKVSGFFAAAHGELEQLLGETSHLLSSLTDSAAVVTGTQTEAATIRSVQLVDLNATVVMVVAVTSTGAVLKRTMDLPGSSTEAGELEDAQSLLMRELTGSSISNLGKTSFPEGARGSRLATRAVSALAEGVAADSDLLYVDGTSRIAGVFDARETLESVLTVLEKQFVVVGLLREMIDGGITVAIGSETGMAPLSECSLVVAPYEAESGPAGAIAVLGPTRMDYTRTMSAVAAVSERLSRLLKEG